mmetsp:Transcript_756/g.3105  ORF Transcript_756/g.3105 Transcript_756/m.3105 type:complete len:305 (-) Transcript_756:3195-4109(-)
MLPLDTKAVNGDGLQRLSVSTQLIQVPPYHPRLFLDTTAAGTATPAERPFSPMLHDRCRILLVILLVCLAVLVICTGEVAIRLHFDRHPLRSPRSFRATWRRVALWRVHNFDVLVDDGRSLAVQEILEPLQVRHEERHREGPHQLLGFVHGTIRQQRPQHLPKGAARVRARDTGLVLSHALRRMVLLQSTVRDAVVALQELEEAHEELHARRSAHELLKGVERGGWKVRRWHVVRRRRHLFDRVPREADLLQLIDGTLKHVMSVLADQVGGGVEHEEHLVMLHVRQIRQHLGQETLKAGRFRLG